MTRAAVTGMMILTVGQLLAQDPTFEAGVDRTTVGPGDRVMLSFTLSNAGMNGGENFRAPDLSSFYVLSGPNQSSGMQIINGSVSSSLTYGYVLQPRDTGTVVIGAATIEAGGKVLSTDPLTLRIVKGSSPPAASGSGAQGDAGTDLSESLFLKAVVDRTSVLQGEQINLTFKLYTRVTVQNYSIVKNPTLTGFWGEEVENPKNVSLTTETINGKQYRVGVIRRLALFPTQSGKLEISPMEAQTVVQVQDRRRFDPFENFFRDPFGKSVEYTVRSAPVKVDVRPLPTGADPAFKGAVGRFTMTTDLDKHTTKANEPVSLKVTISGSGNIKLLESPSLTLPPGFEQFSPRVSDNVNSQGELVTGSKTFEYLLIPRYPGEKTIDPVTFSYFDLKKRDYVTLRSPELKLSVEPSAAVAGGVSGPVREGVQVLSEDIRFIKVGDLSLVRRGERPFSSPLFLVLLLLPAGGFAGLLVYSRRREAAMKDATGYRTRRAARVARKGLKSAEQLLGSREKKERFYDEVSRAIWKYLSDKLNIQQADMSVDRALERIERYGVDGNITGSLRNLLEACEMARFAPAGLSEAEMKKTYDEAHRLLVELEKRLRSA